MHKIGFRVDGLPPKKHGEQSMWQLEVEARRLVALRRAAHQALAGAPPLKANIRLTLIIHVGPKNDRTTGDLDNFITGVCDGLMAADPKSKLNDIWSNPELGGIHPSRTLAITDDCEVLSIEARKVIGDDKEPWYEVVLEGRR